MKTEQFQKLYQRMMLVFDFGKAEMSEEWHKKIGQCDYQAADNAISALLDKQKRFPGFNDFWPEYKEALHGIRVEQSKQRQNHCPDCEGKGLAHVWEYRPDQDRWYSSYCLCNCAAGPEIERQFEESDNRLKRQHNPGISMADLTKRERRGHKVIFDRRLYPPDFEMPNGEADPDLVKAMSSLMETVAGASC